VIGIPPPSTTVIESFGSTSLVQLGSNYFLDPVSGGTGVELTYNGSPVLAGSGQFSGWRPIGAEGGMRTKLENQPHALGYAPGEALRSENKDRDVLPVSGDGKR
jgi:hypothetical protein